MSTLTIANSSTLVSAGGRPRRISSAAVPRSQPGRGREGVSQRIIAVVTALEITSPIASPEAPESLGDADWGSNEEAEEKLGGGPAPL